jgi:hypothetical protein
VPVHQSRTALMAKHSSSPAERSVSAWRT